MARQYDVEDLLNSDASDPDGEPTPIATNDDVRDGKIIVETADGTGKIGDVSQIVADYLKKSAGFYTEVRPYYIVRPATNQAWTGTWELFLHGIDDGGLSDAVNITIGINGVVVHTQAWTADSGARDIEFSISATESTALIASPPTGSYARCYVAFHDSEGNEIVIRHFSLKLVDTVPKIPEDQIPDSIARDDEVTEAIAAALAAHPGAFSANLPLGSYENANGGAISGHYVRTNARVDLSYTNFANENKETEIRGIQVGFGLAFGDKIFVIEWTNENAAYREFNGFWVAGEVDTTAESSTVAISVIQHELRMIRFMTASQLKKLLPEVQQAHDKTVDIHLQETIGEFANMNDATVAGIALVLKTTESDRDLRAGTYNFGALTWQTTSVDIPNDSNQYYVVVRIAKSQGRIETQFQVTNDSDSEPTEYLRGAIQEDATWRYYRVVGDYDNVWTLQRRGTTTHTRFDGPLGDIPIQQVQGLIPEGEGLTPQQKAQFESLVAKTADILIETRETWVAATDASFLALPADNAQLARVRAGNTPTGLSGWTTDVTTTEARVILLRVPLNAQLADYRILLGDDNAVRLDTYGLNATGTQYAYMTSTSLSLQEPTRIRLQHHGNTTHTRFIGMLADAIMARLLPDPSGAEAGQVVQVNTALNGYILATLAAGGLSAGQLARLVPDFSSEPDGDFLRLVSGALAWDAAADFLTKVEFRDYRPHTPERGDTLPAHLLPQGTFVLQKTSHWSDKFYRFYPVWRNIDIGGQTHRDIGTIEVPISSEWTVFEDDDNANPAIFSATRIAGMVYRQTEGPTIGYRWHPKIIMDRALFPQDQGAYDYSGLSIRMRTDFGSHFDTQLFQTTFDADDQTGSVTEIVAGGKTYVCFRPNPNAVDARTIFDNVVTNDTWLSFQILKSKSASPVFPPTDPQFLSDDPATPWVDGDEFETGLYEGDANGHPQKRILPPVDIWDHVVARSNTYFSGTSPDPAAGVDGQFWANLRNGQIHQKQSGTWTLITDLALQTEISRATEWSTIPNNRQIPADFIARVSGRYFGAKLQHVKTSGSMDPTGDATNWIELSNETAVVGADGRIIFTTGRPANDVGKVGDVAFRRVAAGVSLYEKTGTATWTFRYDLDLLPTRPPLNARDGLGLFWDGNTVGWHEPPVRYAELTINSSVALSRTYASLTFAATLAKSQNATGVIARATSGSAISIAAGSYVVDTHIVVAGSNDNARSNYDVQLYDGTNIVDEKTHIGYVREHNELGDESFSSHHILTVAQTTTLQVRVKISQTTSGTTSINTAAGGTIIIRKL